MPRKHKDTKIVVRKMIGREGAVGRAYEDTNEIHIDPRQNAKELLDTFIHEKLHLLFPKLSETQIKRKSRALSSLLWDMGYRLTQLE